MTSISYNSGIAQVPHPTSFHYALKLSPQHIERLNRDELLVLCKEQYFLLWLVIAIIRNPLAAIATRVIALDLIFSMVEKNVRGKIKEITERSRVYISGDGGAAKRLGIHPNTVSKTYKNLETYRMVERTYLYDEATQKEYLDLTLTALQLQAPEKLQDKTLRKMPALNTQQPNPQARVSPTPTDIFCPACGAGDVHIICRACGSVSTPEEVQDDPQPGTRQSIHETGVLLHKIYEVDSINAPLHGAVVNALASETDDSDKNNDDGSTSEPSSDVARVVDASPTPPPPTDTTATTHQEDENQVIISWLAKRIGHGKLIYATGSSEYSKKYKSKPQDYTPDYQAYIAGDKRHILGSYLSRVDGTTSVLAFDIDDPLQHKNHLVYLQKLAAAGAAPVYWMRAGDRGHLELYFDRRVAADRARAWCISICPELARIEECYPALDKRNQPIGWPLYQRKGDTVTACRARAMLPHVTQVKSASVQNRQGLAALILQAVTPAALVDAYQPPEIVVAPMSVPQAQGAAAPLPTTEDLAKIVIAEFNAEMTWDEVARLCGGFNREGKFKAVWRNERTPSVAIDTNGWFASDYGRTAGFPRKLDKYEVWCLAQGGAEFKRFDLAQRLAAYRDRVKDQAEASPSPTVAQRKSAPEIAPEQPFVTQPVSQPRPDETADEVVERLRVTAQQSKGRVMTPAGAGKLWQVWPIRIGVVLESDPQRVRFFTDLEDMRRIIAAPQDQDAYL